MITKFLFNKSTALPLVVSSLLIYATVNEFIPIHIGPIIILAILLSVALIYTLKGVYNAGYWSVSFSMIGFTSFGFILGFDNIFPYTALFFYAGSFLAYIILIFFLYPSYVDKKAISLYYLILMLLVLAFAFTIILFPNILYIYIPILIAVPTSITINSFISKRYTDIEKKKNQYHLKFTHLFTGIVSLLLLIFISVSTYININKPVKPIEYSEEQKNNISKLLKKIEIENSIESYRDISIYYYNINDFENANNWFLKTLSLDKLDSLSNIYIGLIKAEKAKNVKGPSVKMKLMSESFKLIDETTEANKSNSEILYLRAKLYSKIPLSFGKRNTAIKDLNFILTHFDASDEYYNKADELLKKL